MFASLFKKPAKPKFTIEMMLLDVRTDAEYAEQHAMIAKHIPLDQLPARLNELDPSKAIAVHCRSGMRAQTAVSLLQKAGFKEVINVGGLADISSDVEVSN